MKFTKEHGITLLALIITIIVLVILAGVALNTLFGNNGILNNSKYSTEQYTKSVEKEAIALAFADLKMKLYTDDNITEITEELLEQRLNDAGNNVEVTDGENGNFVITFKDTGDQYEVTANGKVLGEDKTEVGQGTSEYEDEQQEELTPTNPDYFNYSISGANATITGFSELGITAYNNGEIDDLILPNENPNGLVITSIGNSAFNGYTEIKGKVIIPDSVTSIGIRAFQNDSKITKVEFGSGLKTIGHSSFSGTGLTGELVIPDSVTSISGFGGNYHNYENKGAF